MSVARRASFSYPRQWSPRQVPTWPVELNCGHPLAANLASLHVFGSEFGLNNIVGGAPTSVTALTYTQLSVGLGIGFTNGSGNNINIGSVLSSAAKFSIFAIVQTSNAVSGVGTIAAASVANGFQFRRDNSGLSLLKQQTAGIASVASGLVAGQTQAIGCSYDGTAYALYIDGISVSSGSSSQSLTNAPIRIGAGSGGGEEWAGGIASVAIFSDIKPPQLFAEHAAKPFVMLRPIIRRSYSYAGVLARRRPIIIGAY